MIGSARWQRSWVCVDRRAAWLNCGANTNTVRYVPAPAAGHPSAGMMSSPRQDVHREGDSRRTDHTPKCDPVAT